MKVRLLIAVCLGALAAGWIVHSNTNRTMAIESRNQVKSIEQNRSEAKGLLLAQCTNALPGLARIVAVSIDDSDDLVSKWKGRATVEYTNTLGGLDRTNLLFTFGTPYGDMLCTLDAEWIASVQRAELDRKLEAAQH